jgi:hypothetical protein
MVRNILLVLIAAIALGGCSAKIVKEDQVVHIDPDKLDRAVYGDTTPQPTPDHVMVGMKNGITVDVDKKGVEHDSQNRVELQIWEVTATNFNDTPKCVTLMWQLMDFEYISFGPSEQYIKALTANKLGEMRQQYWVIDGARVAFPPSGYLSNMRVRDPVAGAKIGEECMHLTPEEDIVTQPDIEK